MYVGAQCCGPSRTRNGQTQDLATDGMATTMRAAPPLHPGCMAPPQDQRSNRVSTSCRWSIEVAAPPALPKLIYCHGVLAQSAKQTVPLQGESWPDGKRSRPSYVADESVVAPSWRTGSARALPSAAGPRGKSMAGQWRSMMPRQQSAHHQQKRHLKVPRLDCKAVRQIYAGVLTPGRQAQVPLKPEYRVPAPD
jgi:hypothetical protein